MGLEVSRRGFLQNQLVQRQISHGPLESRILSFRIFESFRLIELEPSILLTPAIVRGIRDTPLPANILDRLPLGQKDFRLAKFVKDLFDREFNAWHDTLL